MEAESCRTAVSGLLGTSVPSVISRPPHGSRIPLLVKKTSSRTLYEGVTHEFFGIGADVDAADDAVAEAADRLTDAFTGAGLGTPAP